MGHRFQQLLVEQCAPTLAGVKVGSLFRISGLSSARTSIRFWDQALSPLGLRVTALKECHRSDTCMVYVYREAWLQRHLTKPSIAGFLASLGYDTAQGVGMLRQLSHRFCLEQEYPHEIGVFLGYPLEDVIGFITHRGRDFTCCGHWKCYGDPAAAQERFQRYRACTAELTQRFYQGEALHQLVEAAA